MYAISATITHSKDGWESTRQVPMFYLDEDVQGIVDEAHAVRIAVSIIRATKCYDNFVNVCAVKL